MYPPLNREFPPVFDGHEDFITAIKPRGGVFGPRGGRDFLADGAGSTETDAEKRGHVDLPRAMRGGLGGCSTGRGASAWAGASVTWVGSIDATCS